MTAKIRHTRSPAHVQLHEGRNLTIYKLCIVCNNVYKVVFLLAFSCFHACLIFSGDSIRSSRFSFGVGFSITCSMSTPPFGFIASWKLIDAHYPFSVFGPSPCPGHYTGYSATMASADSAQSHQGLLPVVLPLSASARFLVLFVIRRETVTW